jgi:hypothetical protein
MKQKNTMLKILVYALMVLMLLVNIAFATQSVYLGNAEEFDILAKSGTSNNGVAGIRVENNVELGQNLSIQINDRKEEIRSGEYITSFGHLLNVRELAYNLKELRVNGVSAETSLNISAQGNSERRAIIRTKLQNGTEREIKIMPDVASKQALAILGVKVCSAENNCTIQLKSVGTGNNERIIYTVQLERNSKLFGLISKKMHVSVDVDAETGKSTTHKPWWAFMATEQVE